MAKSGIYAFGVIYQTKVVYVYQDKIGHVEKGKISIWVCLSIFRVAEEMDKIYLKNIEIFANHGVFQEEKILGQKFILFRLSQSC